MSVAKILVSVDFVLVSVGKIPVFVMFSWRPVWPTQKPKGFALNQINVQNTKSWDARAKFSLKQFLAVFRLKNLKKSEN